LRLRQSTDGGVPFRARARRLGLEGILLKRPSFMEEMMRVIANYFVTSSLVALVALAAAPAQAANLEASSSVDAVTVYPDGARRCRPP
jgi:hypothetical protein